MAVRVWHQIEDDNRRLRDEAEDQTRAGGDLDRAMVFAVLLLANNVRLVAEAISELELADDH